VTKGLNIAGQALFASMLNQRKIVAVVDNDPSVCKAIRTDECPLWGAKQT
jgi:predicted dehydrogenase